MSETGPYPVDDGPDDSDRLMERMIRVFSDPGHDDADGDAPVAVTPSPRPRPPASSVAVWLPVADDAG